MARGAGRVCLKRDVVPTSVLDARREKDGKRIQHTVVYGGEPSFRNTFHMLHGALTTTTPLKHPAHPPPFPPPAFTHSEDSLNLFFMGNSHRVMGETPANRASSRSHAVFTLTISSSREEEIPQSDDDDYDGDAERSETRTIVNQCELTLVDLAGCERMYKNDGQG